MLERIGMARSVFYYHLKHLNNTDGYDVVRRRITSVYDEIREDMATEESVTYCAVKEC